ncbi:fimbria/pilus outer membrane usher protein [Serratia inhibens]|uniref:fimbria/pilus outer membrane usher protein n=1 Tax=Serratia inhibens TaxID=2338073 RepID=UPI0008096915|nr:fimbria/pilus outer membrane usher protein [Serratia inhibens]ANS44733.1 Outer membrane usher protein HtrE [Serratia inhibens PRI-2C]
MNRDLSVVALGLIPTAIGAQQANITQFDTETLKALGVSATVGDYFREAARFSPGNNEVMLIVNGTKRGSVEAKFDSQGKLCAGSDLLRKANIAIPAILLAEDDKEQEQQSCPQLDKLLPGSNITLQPGKNTVEMLIPPQLLEKGETQRNYIHGGKAVLLNYNVFGLHNRNTMNKTSRYYANLEAGLNAGNWLLRSNGSYTSENSIGHYLHQNAYIQRTFTQQKATLQVGQLNLYGALFSVPMFTGLQWFPEDALTTTEQDTVVSGTAPSPAHVEVSQGGMLIYSTLVPAGPFTLSQLPLMSQAIDLEVSVIENSGGRSTFRVASSSFASNFTPTQSGISFATGQIDRFGRNGNTDRSFITGTRTWPLYNSNLTSGALLTQHYVSTGINLDTSLAPHSRAYLRGTWARHSRQSTSGLRTDFGYSQQLTPALSANVSAGFQTQGYRNLMDSAIASQSSGTRRQYNMNLSYSYPLLGSVSLGFSHSETFSGQASNRPVVSWGRAFGQTRVSLTAETGGGEERYYLNVSMPFGQSSANLYARKDGDQTQYGVSTDRQLSDTVGYSISASTSGSQHRQNAYSGSLRLKPRFTQMNLGYSGNSNHTHSLSASMRGGVVHDGEGMLFSPEAVQDTFSIVTAPGLANAKVQAPGGLVRTNSKGRALVPSIPPYSDARLALVTKGLPRNAEVRNGSRQFESARGSVSHIAFDVAYQRRVLLQITPSAGQAFAAGTGVMDSQGNYLTVVGSDSDVYLDAESASKEVWLDLGDNKRCLMQYQLDEQPADNDDPYEIVNATCHEGTQ